MLVVEFCEFVSIELQFQSKCLSCLLVVVQAQVVVVEVRLVRS